MVRREWFWDFTKIKVTEQYSSTYINWHTECTTRSLCKYILVNVFVRFWFYYLLICIIVFIYLSYKCNTYIYTSSTKNVSGLDGLYKILHEESSDVDVNEQIVTQSNHNTDSEILWVNRTFRKYLTKSIS